MNKLDDFLFYCGRNNVPLGKKMLVKLGEYLGAKLEFSLINFGTWSDGCPHDEIINFEKVEGKNIILFDSLISKESIYDFLSLSYALKHQYKAKMVIAIVPFLLLRRLDHLEKMYEIQYLKQFFDFLSKSGVDEFITCDPHSSYMEEAAESCGIKFHPAYMDFSNILETFVPPDEEKIVYSPDQGSIHRAIAHAKKMPGIVVVFDLKSRGLNNQTKIVDAGEKKIESIKQEMAEKYDFDINRIKHTSEVVFNDTNVIMLDDEVSTARTSSETASNLRELGAKGIYFAWVHPVCTNGWKENILHKKVFTQLIATDTIVRDLENRTGGKVFDQSSNGILAAVAYKSIRSAMNKS